MSSVSQVTLLIPCAHYTEHYISHFLHLLILHGEVRVSGRYLLVKRVSGRYLLVKVQMRSSMVFSFGRSISPTIINSSTSNIIIFKIFKSFHLLMTTWDRRRDMPYLYKHSSELVFRCFQWNIIHILWCNSFWLIWGIYCRVRWTSIHKWDSSLLITKRIQKTAQT